MSRSPDPPYLRRIRAKDEIVKAAEWLLSLHDTGERVPESAWEVLRERIAQLMRAEPST